MRLTPSHSTAASDIILAIHIPMVRLPGILMFLKYIDIHKFLEKRWGGIARKRIMRFIAFLKFHQLIPSFQLREEETQAHDVSLIVK